jgi:hypothetical protein
MTIITFLRTVHLSQLHYRLDHPKSDYFGQKEKFQSWVAICLHSSETISPDLLVSFLLSFVPANHSVTSDLPNLKIISLVVFSSEE